MAISLRACLFDLITLIFDNSFAFFLGSFLNNWVNWEEFPCLWSALSTSSLSTASICSWVWIVFSRLSSSVLLLPSDSPSFYTNEVSCAEEVKQISGLILLKTGSICLNQNGSFDRTRTLPRLVQECNCTTLILTT